jgi:CRP/FNR family cyclic AMP-dependent transcriptional regulator
MRRRVLQYKQLFLVQMTFDMPHIAAPSMTPDTAIANFRASAGETLQLHNWRDADWQQLFRFTTFRSVAPGDALIRHGEPDRTIFFVLRGQLEVVLRSGDGISLGRVALVEAGSILGEVAFFDGGPRSATAWAVDGCEVAAMTSDQFREFGKTNPDLARELVFALGRILATRLRQTNARLVS